MEEELIRELEAELKQLENLPPLSPEEQTVIDLIAGFMVEQYFANSQKGQENE